MREHQLENMPGSTLSYTVDTPPQIQTRGQEGLDAGIQIHTMFTLGREVAQDRFCVMLEANEYEWVGEILDSLKRRNNGR